MNAWIAGLIARIAGGEKLERSTPEDWRLWGSAFAFFPVFLIVFLTAGRAIMDASAFAIWISLTLAGAVWFILWQVVFKRLPVWALFLVAILAWPSLALILWMK